MSSLLSSSTDDFPGDSILGDEAVSSTDLDHLQRSLQDRLTDFNAGVGKRYVCRTQRGFLNVHEAPGDPFDTSNIVNQIFQGDMVTSTGPPSGAWIQHDRGGWSISRCNNFTWLQEVED